MKTDFTNGFADFLEERLGNSLFTLRERNKEYRELSDDYTALLNNQYQSIDEYRQAFSKISEVSKKMDHIEKHYLFLVGMREYANIKDALISEHFEKIFVGME